MPIEPAPSPAGCASVPGQTAERDDQAAQPRRPGVTSRAYPLPGSAQQLRIITVTGAAPGPVLAVIGAVHGDELEGPLAIGQLLTNIDPQEISGRLILLPLANPDAVAAGRRCSATDGKNLARVFPGDAQGSVTEALAALISRHVISPADALVDLHSAASASECPLFAGYIDTPGATGAAAAALAHAFGAPIVWRHAGPAPPGRTLSDAEAQGIPAIYAEATGGLVPAEAVIDAYAEGLLRVMQHLGMIAPFLPAPPPPLLLAGDGDTDAPSLSAPVSGLVTRRVQLGQALCPGQLCFEIRGTDGALLAELAAPSAGWPVFLRRSRWAEQGDMLMKLAQADLAPQSWGGRDATAPRVSLDSQAMSGNGNSLGKDNSMASKMLKRQSAPALVRTEMQVNFTPARG